MTASMVLADNAEARNIEFGPTAPGASEAIRMSGTGAKAINITIRNGFGHSSGCVSVTGNDCQVIGVAGSVPNLALVNVTGSRALVSGVNYWSGASGSAVRFSGSTGSVLTGLVANNPLNGLIVLNSPNTNCTGVNIIAADAVGVIWDGSNSGIFDGVISESRQHGLRVDDSDSNRFTGVVENAGRQTTNTYDGVFVEGDSDQNRFGMTVRYGGSGNQMRYGLNISASTCNTNVEASLLIGSGATGAYNNSGTDTRTTDDHIVS